MAVSPEHPLTARVTVNRYWQQFFGAGLVKTAEDFGVQGERPSPSGIARLAGVRISRERLERQSDASADRHQRHVSAIVEGDAGVVRARSGESLARARPALSPAGVHDPRPGAGRQRLARRTSRRPAGEAVSARGHLGGGDVRQIKYEQDHGDALYRRSLYTFWRRIVGPTEFFDTAIAADLHGAARRARTRRCMRSRR